MNKKTEYGSGPATPERPATTGEIVDESAYRVEMVMEELEKAEEEEIEKLLKAKNHTLTTEEREKANKARRKALNEYKSSSTQLYESLIVQPGALIVKQMQALMDDWPKSAFPSNVDSFQRDIIGVLFYLASRKEVPEIAKEFALVEIVDRLENYARNQIYKHYGTYAAKQDFVEDATSEAKTNLISVLPTYDPEKGMPTTFIKASFLAAVRVVQAQLESGVRPSPHTRELMKTVSRIAGELKQEFIEPTADNIRNRMIEKKIPPYTTHIIAKTLIAIQNHTVVYLDDDEAMEIADNKNPTPEKALLDKERDKNFKSFIADNLTAEEMRIAKHLLHLWEHDLPEKIQESADALGLTMPEYNRLKDTMHKRLFIAAESGAYGDEIKARYGYRMDYNSSKLEFVTDESYSESIEEVVNSIVEIDLPVIADGFTKSMDQRYIEAGRIPDDPGRIKSIARNGEVVYIKGTDARSL
jgi:hypothetical protein